MAKLRLKQFDPILSGSLRVSGSSDVTGSLSVSANISALGNISSPEVTASSAAKVAGTLTVNDDILVAQYIKHKGDTDTLINFTDNQLRLKAGGIGFFDMEKDSSTPYSATVNPGGNRINFRVVDRNTNLLLKTDSEKFNVNLYHAGNEKLQTASTGISVTGSMILKESSTLPTAQEGGIVYSGSNFYLGFD